MQELNVTQAWNISALSLRAVTAMADDVRNKLTQWKQEHDFSVCFAAGEGKTLCTLSYVMNESQ